MTLVLEPTTRSLASTIAADRLTTLAMRAVDQLGSLATIREHFDATEHLENKISELIEMDALHRDGNTLTVTTAGRAALNLIRDKWSRPAANPSMAVSSAPSANSQAELVKSLVDAGVHFGHRVSRWNPKMQPYIQGQRNMIHIINVKETIKGLLRAKRFVEQTVASGSDVLFVGTKRQARPAIEEESKRCGMHYVSERWLGGTLTNFRTIRARLYRLEELEKLWESGQIETYSKKMKSTLERERTKIKTNLQGIRKMDRMPGVMIVVDTRREHIAVNEARKLGVKTIALIDTDSDPNLVDLPIPGNDDAMRAIEIVVRELADSAVEGKTARAGEKGDQGVAPGQTQRRRSSRSQFRAEDHPLASAAPEHSPSPERRVESLAAPAATELVFDDASLNPA